MKATNQHQSHPQLSTHAPLARTQLPGTVYPEEAVIYDFEVANDRFLHVVVMGSQATHTHQTVTYQADRDHWLFRRDDSSASARLNDLLTGTDAQKPVRVRVAKTGKPSAISAEISSRQSDSHLEFRSRVVLPSSAWTQGVPTAPLGDKYVVLTGTESQSRRVLTVRLEFDTANLKLLRAVWHSPTNTPGEFFNGAPSTTHSVSLSRTASDPWGGGGPHYYYGEVL
jgi:hypothetical protein